MRAAKLNENDIFPFRLRALRERKGLTQTELAKQSNVSVTMVRRYESKQSEPTLPMLFCLAKALGVDMNTLTGWDFI